MSAQPTEAAATEAQESTDASAEATSEAKPKPSETVDFWKTKAREQEKRAKENAEAAKRLAELEDASKSETQKAADKIADLETRLAQAEAATLRFKVASQYGISDEDADLFLTGSDEETLTKQAKRLTNRAEEQKKSGNHVPNEGRTTTPPKADDKRAFADFLTGRTP